MISDITSGVGLSMTVLAAIGVLAGCIAYFRYSMSKATIELLRNSNDDLRDTINDINAKSVLKDIEFKELEIKYDTVTRENNVLRSINSSKEELNTLITAMNDHNKIVEQNYSTYMHHLLRIEETLVDNHGQTS